MSYEITCSGSIALDTTTTPFKTVENVLGGACSYFSLSASCFTKVHAVSILGGDFPSSYYDLLLSKGVGMSSVQKIDNGKTFHYDSTYSFDFHHRETNKTELNVLGSFEPKLDQHSSGSQIVYLATMPPSKQMEVLKQAKNRKLAFMDTIEFYIKNERETLVNTIANVDGIVINDAEARMLTNQNNLIRAGRLIMEMGPKIVIIKKGEHGSLLFFDGQIIPFPAFPLEDIVDPTGAGDAFAGGFLGAIAKNNGLISLRSLKNAMAYANVMGSITVQEFSVDGLVSANMEKIEKRYRSYCDMLKF